MGGEGSMNGIAVKCKAYRTVFGYLEWKRRLINGR